MKIHQQTEEWNCGVFAVFHALNFLGVEFDPVEASTRYKRSYSERFGLSPNDVLKILSKEGVGYEELICASDEHEKTWLRNLSSNFRKGYPVILLTRNWGHWITVFSYKGDKFLIADSEIPTDRPRMWKENHLLKNARNPGGGTLLEEVLPKVYGIDNLYGVAVNA